MEKDMHIAFAGMDRIERFHDHYLQGTHECWTTCYEMVEYYIKSGEWPTDYDHTPIWNGGDPIEDATRVYNEIVHDICRLLGELCTQDDTLAKATLTAATKKAKDTDAESFAKRIESWRQNNLKEEAIQMRITNYKDSYAIETKELTNAKQRIRNSKKKYAATQDRKYIYALELEYAQIIRKYSLYFLLDFDFTDHK